MDVSTISEADMTALKSQGYTSGDLAMLAETEVKALLAPERPDSADMDPHERAAAEQDAAAAATAVAADAAAAAAAGEDTAPGAESDAFIPTFKAEVPADADEQIKTLRDEERKAFKELMEGTIDAEAYDAIRERTGEEIDKLKTQALTASIFQQANEQATQQAAQREWRRAESAAMEAFKGEGLDYRAKPALLAAYNTHLKTLGADPKNERRDAPWFLAEAHRLTKADLGITTASKPRGISAGVDPGEIPPTLRTVPVAATPAVGGDEFAHLRNLDGLALEKAVAGMTEAQRDRWLSE